MSTGVPKYVPILHSLDGSKTHSPPRTFGLRETSLAVSQLEPCCEVPKQSWCQHASTDAAGQPNPVCNPQNEIDTSPGNPSLYM